MSVIYFTNNAGSGDGSLVKAIEDASPGDIIRPDETVFVGSIIEIVLAETLTIDKNLTLDASPFRVRLDRGGSGTAVSLGGGFEVAFVGYDFTGAATTGNGGGLYAPSAATVTLRRCGFYGCSAAYGGGLCATGVSRVYDCVFVGCRATQYGGGINVARDATLNGVTVAGCVAATGGGAMRVASGTCVVENSILVGTIEGSFNSTATGNVVDIASSQIGFAAPPPDNLTSETWDANAWQNWDLRLFDDASANPSPYRDAGDVEHMSRYDFDGNFRGRETNGVATCSPGAYETIQADLFWIGKDANGNILERVYLNAAVGWATSRFAAAPCNVSPHDVKTIFMGGNFTINEENHFPGLSNWLIGSDEGNFEGGNIIIGGNSIVKVTSGWVASANQFTIGANTTWNHSGLLCAGHFRLGAGTFVYGEMTSKQEERNWFDANTFINVIYATKRVPPNPFYGRINLYRTDNSIIQLDGEYRCFEFVASNLRKDTCSFDSEQEVNGEEFVVKTSPGTTIHATSFVVLQPSGCNEVFTNLVDVKLTGEASVRVSFAQEQDCVWIDSLAVDVSNVDSVNLSDDPIPFGLTVYGTNNECNIDYWGCGFKVDERGLNLKTLTLNAGATLNVDGGKIRVAGLAVADDANVVFSNERADAVLAATEIAYVDAATFSGSGYFATPPGTDVSAATFTEAVRVCYYGANVVSVAASTSGKTVALNWNAETPDIPVLLEQKIVGGWKTVANEAVDGTTTVAVDTTGDIMFRIFDGEKFLLTSAYVDRFHAWLVYDNLFTSAVVVKSYKIVTEVVLMSVYFNANEAPVFLARIVDSATNVPVVPSDVESIALTVYKQELYRGSKRKTELSGWVNVVVPTSAIKGELVVDDPRWKKDSVGYNFLYEPDLREKKLFAEAGEYVAIITVTFKEGNPAPLVFNVSVK